MRSSVELPSIRDQFRQNQLPGLYAGRARDLLPSALSSSPPGARSSTLPPLQRKDKSSRPRKPSVGQNARKPKHERNKSKEFARRLSMDGRKAMSAEPASYRAQGKRWEDLIEAATSATEAEDDRDLTPVSGIIYVVHSSSPCNVCGFFCMFGLELWSRRILAQKILPIDNGIFLSRCCDQPRSL